MCSIQCYRDMSAASLEHARLDELPSRGTKCLNRFYYVTAVHS